MLFLKDYKGMKSIGHFRDLIKKKQPTITCGLNHVASCRSST